MLRLRWLGLDDIYVQRQGHLRSFGEKKVMIMIKFIEDDMSRERIWVLHTYDNYSLFVFSTRMKAWRIIWACGPFFFRESLRRDVPISELTAIIITGTLIKKSDPSLGNTSSFLLMRKVCLVHQLLIGNSQCLLTYNVFLLPQKSGSTSDSKRKAVLSSSLFLQVRGQDGVQTWGASKILPFVKISVSLQSGWLSMVKPLNIVGSLAASSNVTSVGNQWTCSHQTKHADMRNMCLHKQSVLIAQFERRLTTSQIQIYRSEFKV